MLLLLIFALNKSFEAVIFDLIIIFVVVYTASDNDNLEDSINEEQDGIWSMLPSFKFSPGKICS